MADNTQKVMNVFAAVSLLTRVLTDNDDGSVPHEVSAVVDELDEIVAEMQMKNQFEMDEEGIEDVVNTAIKLVTAVSEHMLDTLERDGHIFVFHQSLTLALMDLDRSLIKISEGISPDDLSADMLVNRQKLKQICDMIDEDPTLLDSTD